MPESRHPRESHRRHDRVDFLAARALSVVASRSQRAPRAPDGLLLGLLRDAVLSGESARTSAVVGDLLDSGLTPEEIADSYIPALARNLGDMWCEDSLSFTAVTIGVSRLQSLLRELGPEWQADLATDPDAPAILLLSGYNCQHTLGAMLVAGQLRRRGLSVRALLNARPEEVGPMMQRIRFEAVMISVSLGEDLDSVRGLVNAVRAALPDPPPIVLGGAVLTAEGVTAAAIRARSGADHVTNELGEAIQLCGLKTSPRTGAARARRN